MRSDAKELRVQVQTQRAGGRDTWLCVCRLRGHTPQWPWPQARGRTPQTSCAPRPGEHLVPDVTMAALSRAIQLSLLNVPPSARSTPHGDRESEECALDKSLLIQTRAVKPRLQRTVASPTSEPEPGAQLAATGSCGSVTLTQGALRQLKFRGPVSREEEIRVVGGTKHRFTCVTPPLRPLSRPCPDLSHTFSL